MLDSLVELLPDLFYVAVAGVLTAVGLEIEYLAFQNVTSGGTTIGLWMLFVGAVALYAGVEVAREKALPALRGA